MYSEKDSIGKCKEYVDAIYKHNQTSKKYITKSMAITEHGVMYSMVKHFLACTEPDAKERALKPIIGCEVYHCVDRTNDVSDRFHMVLLAKNNEGLTNLYQIVSDGGLHKLKGKTKDFPRTHEHAFVKYGKGIIALSGCVGGLIAQYIINGKYDEAKKKALYYNSLFDQFYLELQPHEFPEQLLVNEAIVKMSGETGIPLVITSDAHYVYKEDKKYHDILKAIAYQKPFTCSAHLHTPEEMEEYCLKYNIPLSAISNTGIIAKQCNADPRPKDRMGLLPTFPCPKGYTESSYLRELSINNLMKFFKKKRIIGFKKYTLRLIYELDIICSAGYAGYFLILWDWFKWCRQNGILMGKGRGSAAGSLVSYVMSITTIDPIVNGFIFERFLNSERLEFPDIDSDISKADRPKGIQYLLQKYGVEYVSQIITFSEYKLKNTIKAVMSAFNYPYQEANEITRTLPDMIDGSPATYDTIVKVYKDPDKYEDLGTKVINDCKRAYERLDNLFKKYPEVYDAVTKLKGCITSTGIHAGGVIISGKKLNENLPMITGSDTAILPLVQIEMADLDFFKALKIDVLGLQTLTQIKLAMDLSGLDYEWYDSEDFSDKDIYEMLRKGETTDIFQMAGFMATKMIQDMKVEDIPGLTVVNAGNRPGPLAKNKDTGKSMVDLYIERRASGIVPSIDKRIDYILKPTLGCIWYQEQCMQLGQVMAGYSLGMADLRIRKVLGKKKIKKIPEIRNEFIYGKKSLYDNDHNVIGISEEDSPYCKGAIANGFSEEVAISIFDAMAEFAKYSFNKAHAGSYGAMAYKTGYLSYYFPVEWAVACLTTYEDTDKITATLSQCKKRGIKILPPDINKSNIGFSVEKLSDGTKAIRYGLQAIKGIGIRAVNFLQQIRKVNNGFNDFDDYYNITHNTSITRPILDSYENNGKKVQNPMKKDVEKALICSGAFDSFNENRHALLNHYMMDIRKEKNYEILIEKDYVRKVKLALEKEYMGSYVSEHPLDPFPYANADSSADGAIIETTGIVSKVTKKKQKNGKTYGLVNMETKDGKDRKVMLFARAWNKYSSRVKKGAIIIITGEINKQFNNINCTRVRIPVGVKQDVNIDDVVNNIEQQSGTQSNFVLKPKDDPFGDEPFINEVSELIQQYGG